MAVIVEQSEGECRVRIEGEINIAAAAELKKMLIAALAPGKNVRVELEGVAGIDITTLQLLWAAEREARRLGVGFAVAGAGTETLAAVVAEAGLEGFRAPGATQ